MILKEERFIAKDKNEYILRTANEDEAKDVLAYLKQVMSETDYLGSYSDEIKFSVEDEKEFIKSNNSSSDTFFMIILDKDKVIGSVALFKKFQREKTKHRCTFGISILQEYTALGIGTYVLQRALDIAKELGYEQIELEVVESNLKGVSLYKKLGFVEFGKLPSSMKLRNGTYLSEFLMYKNL